MQSVGEKLRRARLEKRLSLEQVYKQTKVYPHVLEALEQDRAHNFLSFIYIKGFLKTYAQYLGLDTEKLLQEYIDSQKAETAPAEVVVEKEDKTASFKVNPSLILRSVVACLLAIGLIFYFRYVWKNISTSEEKVPLQKVKVTVTPVAAPPAAPVKRGNLVVEVRTKDQCWIKVKADEEVVFQKALLKGRTERWQAKENLELRIGKPEALEVFLNGRLIDLKKAKVKRTLVITREGIQGK